MKVVFTGGGTGGHLYPGLAIMEELEKRIPCEILFIGTKRGLEAKIVPQKGYQFRTVWISGLRRGKILKNILFPIRMLVSLVQALVIIMIFKPDVLVGTGGYVSWPVLTAGILLGRRTVIQEQNRAPGLVTRLLAPCVDSVHLSFDASTKLFRKKSNLHVSGNPTRNDLNIYDRNQAYKHFGLHSDKRTLFVFGGSQGARSINQAFLDIVDTILNKTDVQIIWATGPRWYEGIENKVRSYSERIRVFPYIQEMALAYGVSDLIICRAGATTVAEVTRLGIPVIFIPFPGAARGHQEENARILWEAGAAEMVLEDEISVGRLEDVILRVISDTKSRGKLGEMAKKFGKPDAAKIIVDDILMKEVSL